MTSLRHYQSALLHGKVNEESMRNNSKKPIKKKNQEKASTVSSMPFDGSGEHHHLDRLDGIVQDLIREHKEKNSCVEAATSLHDLKGQYSRVLSSNSITEVKDILATAVQENFELKQELLRKDSKLLELQLDQINSNLRKSRSSRLSATPSKYELCQVLEEASAVEKDLKIRLAKAEIDLIEKSNILRDVGARMVVLEDKCERLEAENVFLRKTHENCVKSLRSRNEVLEKRCEKLDNRRKLDCAGFSEDIRECKWLLKNLTRNISKCVKLYSDARASLPVEHGKRGSGDQGMLYEEGEMRNSKSDRITKWLLSTNPKIAQTAMHVWAEYMDRQVNQLGDSVARIKVDDDDDGEYGTHVLYTNRKNSKSPKSLSGETHIEDEEEKSDSYEELGDVPPSPTWIRIRDNAGLNLSSSK